MWHSEIWNGFEAQAGYDLVVLDSQWIGEAVEQNRVLEVTDLVNSKAFSKDDYYANTLAAYGEYPPFSGRFYGVPFLADVQIMAFRRDLFEQMGKADVEDLPDLLATAQQLQANGNLTGIQSGFSTIWCGNYESCYDNLATVWNQIAWSMGGEIWDPSTYRIDGVLNSEINVKALEFARDLARTGPTSNLNHNFAEVTSSICNGESAIIAIWGGAMAPVLDSATCPHAGNISFTIFPGDVAHQLSLGGMGMHISAYTRHPEVAKDVLAWLSLPKTQRKWAEKGQFPTRKSVLGSGTFLNARPFNPAFAISFTLSKDFWNLPIYAELLPLHVRQIDAALRGTQSAFDALNQLASEQQAIMDRAYPDGPPKPKNNVETLRIHNGAAIAMFIIVSLALMYSCVIVSFIGYHRNTATIIASSPVFCYISLAGAILMLFTAILPAVFQPGASSTISQMVAPCMVNLWFFGISFILMFAPIFAKTYRLYRIFKIDVTVQKVRITNTQLLGLLGVLLAIELVILIVWTAYDPLKMMDKLITAGTQRVTRCNSKHWTPFWIAFLGYKVLLVLFGVFVTFQTRGIYKFYRESRQLSWCLYNACLLAAVCAPLLFYLNDPTAWFLVQSVGILLLCVFFVSALFIPKILDVNGRSDSSSDTSTGFTSSGTARSQPRNRSGPL
jgi:multiple sugar transport system substrate-binding protein